jgi:hypothetical protein
MSFVAPSSRGQANVSFALAQRRAIQTRLTGLSLDCFIAALLRNDGRAAFVEISTLQGEAALLVGTSGTPPLISAWTEKVGNNVGLAITAPP